MKSKLFMVVGLCAIIGVGCGAGGGGGDGGGGGTGPTPTPKKSVALKRMTSCGDVQAALREVLTHQMEARIDTFKTWCEHSAIDVESFVSSPAMTTADTVTAPGVTFTSTNTQEASVDEADLIKTDGTYIYVVGKNTMHVAWAWPLSAMKAIGGVSIEGTPRSLFLADHLVVVLSMVDGPTPAADAQRTKVTVIDVHRPEVPVVVRESFYRGKYVAERRIGNRVYLVLEHVVPGPQLKYNVEEKLLPHCDANGKSEQESDELLQALSILKEKNRRAIETYDLSQPLAEIMGPSSEKSAIVDSAASCSDVYYSEAGSGSGAIHVVGIDLADVRAKEQHAVVLGNGGTIYASPESLYVAGRHRDVDQTVIHRFALGDVLTYAGSTAIDGSLLNQFSMGEYAGVLRVATTGGAAAANQVFTLDATGPGLATKGHLGGLAQGERVYAVRFVGPRGYVVTFKKIDPLFVIDLHDPSRPVVAGELKVPGFSTYLHPMDERYLIGLGKDADDQGTFAWFQGLKLSLFDVSNPNAPTEQSSVVIGGRGSDSEALGDHHAFTFDATRRLLALPVKLYSKTSGGNTYGKFEYSGLQLYRVSSEKGFELVGIFKLPATDGGQFSWDAYSHQVRRSILLGDGKEEGLVTLQADGISAHTLDAQLTVTNTVTWE